MQCKDCKESRHRTVPRTIVKDINFSQERKKGKSERDRTMRKGSILKFGPGKSKNIVNVGSMSIAHEIEN